LVFTIAFVNARVIAIKTSQDTNAEQEIEQSQEVELEKRRGNQSHCCNLIVKIITVSSLLIKSTIVLEPGICRKYGTASHIPYRTLTVP